MASFRGQVFDDSPEVDFCIWVLEVDGVHIPPFDRHPAGSGPLATSGMPPGQWHDWIHAVALAVDRQEYLWVRTDEIADEVRAEFIQEYEPKLARAGGKGLGTLAAVRGVARVLRELFVRLRRIEKSPRVYPPELWTGDKRVAARLRELWKAYQPQKRERRRVILSKSMFQFVSSPERDRLEKRVDELYVAPSLHPQIKLLRYPWPTMYLIPGSRVVMGVKGWVADPEAMMATFEDALESLVGASSK
jgi:hypothetical protein